VIKLFVELKTTFGRSGTIVMVAAVVALGCDVHQMKNVTHHGDNITNCHDHVHLPKSSM